MTEEPNLETTYRRMRCECGQPTRTPTHVVFHALMGHEIVMETFRSGRWRRSPMAVGEVMMRMMQQKGEDTEAFVTRIEAYADYLEGLDEQQRAVAEADGIVMDSWPKPIGGQDAS